MHIGIPTPDSFDKYYKNLSDYQRGKFDATLNNTVAFSFGPVLNLVIWEAVVKRRACVW